MEKINELIKPYLENLPNLREADLKILAIDAFQAGMESAKEILIVNK